MGVDLTGLLVIVLVGYWYQSRTNSLRISLKTSPNYAIFYLSAISGLFIFIVVWFLLGIVKIVFSDCSLTQLMNLHTCGIENLYPIKYIDAIVLSLVFAQFVPWIQNRFTSLEKVMTKIAKESGAVAKLIFAALDERSLVEIATVRRMVYVGWIISTPGISKDGTLSDLTVLTLYSGFLDESELSLKLSSDFTQILQENLDINQIDSATDDMLMAAATKKSVALPINEIAFIAPYTMP